MSVARRTSKLNDQRMQQWETASVEQRALTTTTTTTNNMASTSTTTTGSTSTATATAATTTTTTTTYYFSTRLASASRVRWERTKAAAQTREVVSSRTNPVRIGTSVYTSDLVTSSLRHLCSEEPVLRLLGPRLVVQQRATTKTTSFDDH